MTSGVEPGELNRAEAASLLAWWLESGVDVAISDEARDWRASRAPLPLAGGEEARSAEGEGLSSPVAGQTLPQPLPQAGGEMAAAAVIERPTSLDAYHAWLAETASLPLFRAGAGRALPHGPAEAEIMLLSGLPAPEDIAEGRPIGGAAWVLTERMLAAIGFKPDQAYVAALTCFSGSGTRLGDAEVQACADEVRAMLQLVRPKRLLLFGDAPARALLGSPLASARGKVHRVGGVPTVVTFHPRHLLGRSADKALAWRDLLLLMSEAP